MKKCIVGRNKSILVTLLLAFILLVGCSNKNEMKDIINNPNLKEYSFEESKEYDCMELSYDGKIYRPFCSGDSKNLSEKNIVGYYTDDSEEKVYLFLLDGVDSDNWLISVCVDESGEIDSCNSYFIWKELQEQNIPKGIEVEPDYKEWSYGDDNLGDIVGKAYKKLAKKDKESIVNVDDAVVNKIDINKEKNIVFVNKNEKTTGEVFKIIYKTNDPVLGDLFVYYDSSKDEIVAYGLRD